MRNFLIVLTTTSLFSCTNNILFRGDKEIETAWHADSLAVFHFHVSDTTKMYYSEIKLRHSTSYSYQNLFVFIHTTNPAGKRITDTVECVVADKAGKWKGNGIGDILEFSSVYNEGVLFEKSGEYKVEIEQAMRYGKSAEIQRLEEIKSIGVYIARKPD